MQKQATAQEPKRHQNADGSTSKISASKLDPGTCCDNCGGRRKWLTDTKTRFAGMWGYLCDECLPNHGVQSIRTRLAVRGEGEE